MYRIKHFGRLPHVPDRRDFDGRKVIDEIQKESTVINTKSSTKLRNLLGNIEPKKATALPTSWDNTKYDTPIEDQGDLGSCVSFGSCGALEYLHNMLYKKYTRFSKLYTYAIIRRANKWPIDQDTGAYIRSGLGVLVRAGALQDIHWPYDLDTFEDEPKVWYQPFIDDYKTMKYFRLDYPNTSKDGILQRIKTYIHNKFPVIVGFYCFETIDSEETAYTGNIPYPATDEANVGGHCIMALGYDNSRKIKNPIDGSTTTGAFKCRNSWGPSWGDKGYAWLPYAYLMEEKPYLLADEWYSITKSEWLEYWQFDE